MRIQVLFFARARELAGLPASEVEIPAGATVSMTLARIGEEFPRLASYLSTCRLAVDEELAAAGDTVRDGAVVAVIPPVSGG